MTAGEALAGELVLPGGPRRDLVVPGLPDELGKLVRAWLLESCDSPESLTAYRRDIGGWFEWLRALDVEPLDATREHASAWRRLMETTPTERTGRPPAPATVARRMSVVASFYAFALDEGLVERQPVTKRMRPRVADDSPTVGLSRDEARAFLARLAVEAAVDRAVLHMLVGEGLRVGELVGLDVGSLGFAEGQAVMTVVGKGNKRRRLVLSAPVYHSVGEYLAERVRAAQVDELDPAAPLFATVAGGRFDRRSIMRRIQRIARAAGILSWAKLSPHSLRHACATLMLDAGAPIDRVQDHLGHADTRTTRRYDRARGLLSRTPVHTLAAYLAPDGE